MLFKELSGYIYIFEIFTVTIKNVTLNIFYFQKRPVTFFFKERIHFIFGQSKDFTIDIQSFMNLNYAVTFLHFFRTQSA